MRDGSNAQEQAYPPKRRKNIQVVYFDELVVIPTIPGCEWDCKEHCTGMGPYEESLQGGGIAGPPLGRVAGPTRSGSCLRVIAGDGVSDF